MSFVQFNYDYVVHHQCFGQTYKAQTELRYKECKVRPTQVHTVDEVQSKSVSISSVRVGG